MPDRAINTVKKLGRYDIVRVLGKGAMGVVYEALDPNLNRKVAIKTVRVDSLGKDEAAEYELRFRTEAHSAARLQHPNIVSVYDSDRDGNTPFLVMEFVKGEDLKHYLDSGQRYSLEQSVRMMRDLLAALDYAHQRKIVHRDIKPANLLLEADGRVKLTDFGVARIQDSGEATRTQGGMVGTLKYMSPEQVEGKTVDALSDLFSAGIVLYQLLTDRRPFDGDSYFSIVNQITNQQPPAPSSINQMLPTAVDAVVSRALAKDKTQRFATAQDFSLALQAAARRADPTITPSANPYKIIEQHSTGSLERSGSTASSTLTGTGSTVTQELELVYWKDVKDADDIEDVEGFLKRFPDGVYADLAKRRLKRMAQERAEQGQDRYDQTLIAKPPTSEAEALADYTLGITGLAKTSFDADATNPQIRPTETATAAKIATNSALADDYTALARPAATLANTQPLADTTASLASEALPAQTPQAPQASQATTAAASTKAASVAIAPAPRKKTGLIVGLAVLTLGAAAWWAWQSRPSNSIITESSIEAGIPMLGASASGNNTSTASVNPTLAAASDAVVVSTPAVASPIIVSSESSAITTSLPSTTTLTVTPPKPGASSARAIAAAKQAQRDAQARANAGTSSPITTYSGNTTTLAPVTSAQPAANSPSAANNSATSTAPSRPKENVATGPQQACEGRVLFGYGACLYEQCAKPAFFNHPYCADQRERQEKARGQN